MDIRKHQKLYRRIKRAVSETTPELAGNLEQTLEAYSGRPDLLDTFLDRFDSDNPYIATQNAELKQAIFRTPAEIREESGLGLSVSGHKLTDQLLALS